MCDYCDAPGCHWTRHEQAHIDVEQWERQKQALENE